MITLLKILTLPVWLPFKILWFVSKVIAFVFVILFLAAFVYIVFHGL